MGDDPRIKIIDDTVYNPGNLNTVFRKSTQDDIKKFAAITKSGSNKKLKSLAYNASTFEKLGVSVSSYTGTSSEYAGKFDIYKNFVSVQPDDPKAYVKQLVGIANYYDNIDDASTKVQAFMTSIRNAALIATPLDAFKAMAAAYESFSKESEVFIPAIYALIDDQLDEIINELVIAGGHLGQTQKVEIQKRITGINSIHNQLTSKGLGIIRKCIINNANKLENKTDKKEWNNTYVVTELKQLLDWNRLHNRCLFSRLKTKIDGKMEKKVLLVSRTRESEIQTYHSFVLPILSALFDDYCKTKQTTGASKFTIIENGYKSTITYIRMLCTSSVLSGEMVFSVDAHMSIFAKIYRISNTQAKTFSVFDEKTIKKMYKDLKEESKLIRSQLTLTSKHPMKARRVLSDTQKQTLEDQRSDLRAAKKAAALKIKAELMRNSKVSEYVNNKLSKSKGIEIYSYFIPETKLYDLTGRTSTDNGMLDLYNDVRVIEDAIKAYTPKEYDTGDKEITYFLTYSAFKKQVSKIIDFLITYPISPSAFKIDTANLVMQTYEDVVMYWDSVVFKKVLLEMKETDMRAHDLLPSQVIGDKTVKKFNKATFDVEDAQKYNTVGKFTSLKPDQKRLVQSKGTIPSRDIVGSFLQPQYKPSIDRSGVFGVASGSSKSDKQLSFGLPKTMVVANNDVELARVRQELADARQQQQEMQRVGAAGGGQLPVVRPAAGDISQALQNIIDRLVADGTAPTKDNINPELIDNTPVNSILKKYIGFIPPNTNVTVPDDPRSFDNITL